MTCSQQETAASSDHVDMKDVAFEYLFTNAGSDGTTKSHDRGPANTSLAMPACSRPFLPGSTTCAVLASSWINAVYMYKTLYVCTNAVCTSSHISQHQNPPANGALLHYVSKWTTRAGCRVRVKRTDEPRLPVYSLPAAVTVIAGVRTVIRLGRGVTGGDSRGGGITLQGRVGMGRALPVTLCRTIGAPEAVT